MFNEYGYFVEIKPRDIRKEDAGVYADTGED